MAAIKYYKKKATFLACLKGGVIAGITCTFLNNLFSLVYQPFIHQSFPEFLNFEMITAVSFTASLLACFCFYLLSKFFKRPTLIYFGIVVLITLISFIPPVQPLYPDGTLKPAGFAGAAIPLHIFTCLICMYIIPIFGRTKSVY